MIDESEFMTLEKEKIAVVYSYPVGHEEKLRDYHLASATFTGIQFLHTTMDAFKDKYDVVEDYSLLLLKESGEDRRKMLAGKEPLTFD